MARITVVNDDPAFVELVRDILQDEAHTTTAVDVDEHEETVERVRTSRPELLIIDLRMGSDTLEGWRIVETVRAELEHADLPVLICSADLEALKAVRDVMERTVRMAVLAKPFGLEAFSAAIERLLAGRNG